jgi:ubiquinone/menaquinone biosynthesis C-methylase UbiE
MIQRIPHPDESVPVMRDPNEYYDKLKKRSQAQFKPFLKLLNVLNGHGRYLEIGAGPGILASAIVNRFPDAQIKAVELYPDMIELGEKHIKEAGIKNRIQFVQGNVEDKVFMSSLGQFDLVYSTFSLHHWKNPEQALRLMVNAVDQNGTLMIFDFKRVWWLYIHPKHNGFLDSVRASYLPKEMKRMFKNVGIQNFKIQTPFPFFWQIITIQK